MWKCLKTRLEATENHCSTKLNPVSKLFVVNALYFRFHTFSHMMRRLASENIPLSHLCYIKRGCQYS